MTIVFRVYYNCFVFFCEVKTVKHFNYFFFCHTKKYCAFSSLRFSNLTILHSFEFIVIFLLDWMSAFTFEQVIL